MCKGPGAEAVFKATRTKRSVWLEYRQQVGSREAASRGVGEGGRDFRLCWTCILGLRILVSLQNDEKLLESFKWGREPRPDLHLKTITLAAQ